MPPSLSGVVGECPCPVPLRKAAKRLDEISKIIRLASLIVCSKLLVKPFCNVSRVVKKLLQW